MTRLIDNSMKCLVLTAAICIGAVFMQQPVRIPKTSFSCEQRPSGYYADVETGCKVYHMCDGLGRIFSYSCPNTTLFQQRMLICDHWYMVNCSASEKDYKANLLIGQRDKPFVSDSEDHKRTPRPDLLSAPYAQGFNNYGSTDIQFAASNAANHLNDNTIGNGNDDVIDTASLPIHWSIELPNNQFTTQSPVSKTPEFKGKSSVSNKIDYNFNDNGLISQSTEHNRIFVAPPEGKTTFKNNQNEGKSSFQNTKPEITNNANNNGNQRINLFTDNVKFTEPSRDLDAPKFSPTFPVANPDQNTFRKTSSTTVKSIASFNNEFISNSKFTPDFAASAENQDPIFQFINRFNPDDDPFSNQFEDSQTSANEYSSKSKQNDKSGFEIQSSSETAGIATANKANSVPQKPQAINTQTTKVFPQNKDKKTNTFFPEQSIERNPPTKGDNKQNEIDNINYVVKPSADLLPPKSEFSDVIQSTMGPPIYYEWKWAVPALELEPPKLDSETSGNQTKASDGRPDFSLPSSTTEKSNKGQTETTTDQKTSEGKNDYKVQSYFVPDYVFPLDKQHPGYEENDAKTSFQVKIPRTVNQQHPYYGENEECPECHPSFVVPGTCKPCIMIRR